jgi:hypothetical protein
MLGGMMAERKLLSLFSMAQAMGCDPVFRNEIVSNFGAFDLNLG